MNTTVKFLFSTLVAAAAMTSTAHATTIYVDASYTAGTEDSVGTEGFGVTHFNTLEGAIAAAAGNSEISRIEICSDIDQKIESLGADYEIKQNLAIGTANNVSYTVKLSREDGGAFSVYQTSHNSSVVIEKTLTIKGLDIVANGFATSGNNTYINGRVEALSLKQWTSNGEIVVGETGKVTLGYGDGQFDMAYGNGSMTVNGTLDAGTDFAALESEDAQFKAGYSGTRGNGNTLNLKNTYFEAGAWFNINGSNGTFNLDNALLKVSGGDNSGSLSVTSSGNVINVTNGSLLDSSTITLGAGNTININGGNLKATSLSGSGLLLGNGAVNLNADKVSTRVFVGGTGFDEKGYAQYNDALRSTLVLDDVSGNGVMIKDKEFRVNNADITLDADVTADLGNGVYFYLRKSTLDLNGHDLVLNSGKFLPTGLDIVGEGTVIINSPSDQACWQSYASSIGSQATVKGTKQFTIYEDLTVYGKLINEGRAGNGPTHIGFNDDFWTDGAVLTVSGANALVSQTGGAGVQIHGADAEQGIEASKVVVENGATVDWTQAGTVTNGGAIAVDGANLLAKTIANNGTFTVAGNSTFKADKMTSSTDLLFGGANEKSVLAIGSVSGQGLNVTASRVNLYKADITLTDNVTITTTGVLSKIQDSVVDMGGKTLTFNGFTVLDGYSGISTPENGHGVTLKNGEFKVNTNHLCFQGYNHVVAEDAVVTVDGSAYNSSMVNVYGKTTVYGKINVTHGNYGYDNVGTTDTGWSKGNYPMSELTLSGANASYTIVNGHMFRVWHETANTGAGVMNVVGGASFSFTGSRSGTGLFFNSNVVNVDAQSSFTVDAYYGHAHDNANIKGAFNSEKAGEMVVLGKVTVNKNLVTDELVLKNTAQLNAGTIKVIGLTIEQGAELNVGAASQGVALMAVVSVIEFETLTIVTDNTVVAGDKIQLDDIITGSGAYEIWNALANKGEGAEFTVIDSEGKKFTAVYNAGAEGSQGSISVIPEPSMFGLFAGLGALLLVGTRRRRK